MATKDIEMNRQRQCNTQAKQHQRGVVSITGESYAPMVGLFPFLSVPIPVSTVTMPVESLGYTG
jgi:hypothetical protein